MSEPMTADQLMASLIRWGVKVEEHPGWRTNNRAGHGAWGPVNGSMVHHTVSHRHILPNKSIDLLKMDSHRHPIARTQIIKQMTSS